MTRSKAFPNLARAQQDELGKKWDPKDVEEVTEVCKDELAAAGIELYSETCVSAEGLENLILRLAGEVPSKVWGRIGPWTFRRAWYYWIAEGPGIPVEPAMKLFETHGEDARASGDAACRSPLFWYQGFACNVYHVDNASGLKALAETIRSIWQERKPEVKDGGNVSDEGSGVPKNPNNG